MARIPTTNTAEAEIRGTLNGVPVENTLYFHFTSALSEFLLTALAEALQSWFVGELLTHMSNAYVFKEVFTRDLTEDSGLNGLANSSGGTAGSSTEGNLPGNIAWAVKFVTGLAGRSFRGRNYFCGITENQVTGNLLASALADIVLGAYRMLLGGGDVLPDGWTWSVVSRQHDGAPRVSGLVTPITGVSYTDLTIDTQRKRLQ